MLMAVSNLRILDGNTPGQHSREFPEEDEEEEDAEEEDADEAEE